MSDPRIRSLLRQAKSVGESGKRAAAAQLYQQLVEEAPSVIEGWLGLADMLNDTAEKERAYERVLSLEPNNETAMVALAKLRNEPPPLIFKSEPIIKPKATVEPLPTPKPAEVVAPPTIDKTVVDEEEALFCYRHSNRETSLRCYKCERPICVSCTRKTPVGYLCPECQREAENVFFEATTINYLVVFASMMPLNFVLGILLLLILSQIGFFFFLYFILFPVFAGIGGVIGRLAFRIAGRRRGRYMPHMVAATIVIGAMLPGFLFGQLFVSGFYAVVAAASAFYWLK